MIIRRSNYRITEQLFGKNLDQGRLPQDTGKTTKINLDIFSLPSKKYTGTNEMSYFTTCLKEITFLGSWQL